MAASVILQEFDSTASVTDKTSGTVRFKRALNATVDSNDPMVVPPSGQQFSYEKWLQLKITGTPPSDKINNLKFYTDGGNGFGTGVKLWAEVAASGTVRIPTDADAAAVDPPLGGSASITMTDAFTYTSAGALSLSSASAAFSGSGTQIGAFTVLAIEVESTASQGTLTAETGTWSYDEI